MSLTDLKKKSRNFIELPNDNLGFIWEYNQLAISWAKPQSPVFTRVWLSHYNPGRSSDFFFIVSYYSAMANGNNTKPLI